MAPVHAGRNPGSAAGIGEVTVGDESELIRADQLLDEAGQDHGTAALPFFGGGRTPVEVIEEEFAGAHDRPGDQLREERDEERVIHIAADGGLFAAIDIDHIRDALESVEADAERKDDMQRVMRARAGRTMFRAGNWRI